MSEKRDLHWASNLHEDELLKIIVDFGRVPRFEAVDTESRLSLEHTATALRDSNREETIDNLGDRLIPIAMSGGGFGGCFCSDYWRMLKNEFRVLICTSDEKYADLRRNLSSSAAKSQTAIVSAIAAAMASQFGVVAGVLVPFVALCLVVLVRTGKEAFCTTLEWNTPLCPKAESNPSEG